MLAPVISCVLCCKVTVVVGFVSVADYSETSERERERDREYRIQKFCVVGHSRPAIIGFLPSVVPRFSLKTVGTRAFSAIGPQIWNSLPQTLRHIKASARLLKLPVPGTGN